MAVFTELSDEQVREALTAYDLAPYDRHEGIAQGVENTNYHVFTQTDRYILTLFERRTPTGDLPYFLQLMEHLADAGLNVPEPLHGRDGDALRTVGGRPAALFTFLHGRSPKTPTPEQAHNAGAALARLHLTAEGFTAGRPNAMGPEGWQTLHDRIAPKLQRYGEATAASIARDLDALVRVWPPEDSLPRGTVHADFFPDNVFFEGAEVSGIIDFYFACTDHLAYDAAIAALAWMPEGDDDTELGRALLEGYSQVRAFTAPERTIFPLLLRAAAMRFFLTRAHDDLFREDNCMVTVKDPMVYLRRVRDAEMHAARLTEGLA